VTGAKTDTCSPCRETSKTGCPIIRVRGKMDIAQISLRIRVWRNLNTWAQLNAYSQYRVLCYNHFPSVCELEPTSFSNLREQQAACSG